LKIAKRVDDATHAILTTLGASGASLSDDQAAEVRRVVEQTLVHTVLDHSERCTSVVAQCCSPDLDTAHKISEELKKQNDVLIANLSALR